MSEQVKVCPLCGSSEHAPFDVRQFHDQRVTNVICQECGLVFQSPRMTSAESGAFYEAEYRLLYQGQEGPNPKDLAVQEARAGVTLDFVSPLVKSCRRILDIGCSTGALLVKFQKYYQASVIGVEPGNIYRQYAQSQGLNVFSSLDELEQADQPPFDLVSMMHVLEHLPQPVEYLQAVREKHLSAGGRLLVEVPSLYAHDCFEVAHLVSFSPHNLTQVVEKAGYRVIQLRQHGQPRSQLVPLYLTLLARPDGTTTYSLKPDHQVRLKRQAGLFRRRIITRLFPARAWITPGEPTD